MPQVTAYKVDTLVGIKPDAIVALKVPNENKFELYVTSRTGIPFPLKEALPSSAIIKIKNTDENLTISGTSTVTINISNALLATINSALQAGDNISQLVNNAGYITIADVPTFVPNNYDLEDFTNTGLDPFAHQSEITLGITNLSYTQSPTNGVVTSDTGTDATIPLADLTNAGLLSSSEKVSIDSIQNLDIRIDILESLQNLNTNVVGTAYAIWTGVGLTYDVIYPNYYIEGVLFTGATVQRTLTVADPTNPRQDVFALDATGVIVKTGDATPDPVAPSINTQIEIYITTVFIGAGATTPIITEENIYKENIEWTTVSNNVTVNFNAVATPFQGTKHIDCGLFTAGQYLRFTDDALNQITDFNNLKFYLNLKATFNTTTKLSVRFYNGATSVSSTVIINSGTYNFVRTIVNSYQTINIPLTAFTFSSSSFDRIEITTLGFNASGFKLDNIILFQGDVSVSPLQKSIVSIVTDSGIVNATVNDDTITIQGTGKSTVSASGKTITINTSSEVSQTIIDGVTTTAPSENVVFDALALKANTSSLGNFIPLTGTTVDNPVSGDIEFVESASNLYLSANGGDNYNKINFTESGISLRTSYLVSTLSDFSVLNNGIQIQTTDNGGISAGTTKGLQGMYDYSPNITNLDYTQKIYVDNAVASVPTPTLQQVTASGATTDKLIYINTASQPDDSFNTSSLTINTTGYFNTGSGLQDGIAIQATAPSVGIIASGGNIGIYANSVNTGIFGLGSNIGVNANGGNIGVNSYSSNGQAGIFNISTGNTSNIVEFQKNNVNQVVIQNDGKITATAGTASTDVVVKSQLDGKATITYVDGKVSDTAYDATSWDGVTTVAPSKNAVRDKIESVLLSTKAPKTYFINSITGNNTTGIYEDSSKPFATIDYVLSLPAFKTNDIVWLQDEGTFPLNGTFQALKNVIIKSDVAATLSFSSNTNTELMPSSFTLVIDIPLGSIVNERSGGTGVYFYGVGFQPYLYINALSLYWNTSNIPFRTNNLTFNVKYVSVRTILTYRSNIGVKDTNIKGIVIERFTCLADNATFSTEQDSRVSISISHITGAGSFYFSGGRYNVGNITTTNPCVIGAGYDNTFINFMNSYISTTNGINIAGDVLYNTTITGNILYSPKITGGRSFRGGTNIKYLNFSADLGLGTITLDQGTYTFENCSIKSTNSPITLIGYGTYNLALILKSSVFEVVNAVPLVTGGNGSGDTINIAGLSTNATMISDQEGTGVTVNVIGKQPVANGVAPKDAVNLSQVPIQLKDFYADVNNLSTTETDLFTYTTLANRLNATGEKLISNFAGTFNDVTASSQLKLYFAGTNIGDTGALTMSVTGAWVTTVSIIRTGATTARAVVNVSTPGASTAAYTKYTALTGLTFTGTNIIKITGTAAGATGGNDDITASYGNIIWQPAAL